jgi:hypothetical protein
MAATASTSAVLLGAIGIIVFLFVLYSSAKKKAKASAAQVATLTAANASLTAALKVAQGTSSTTPPTSTTTPPTTTTPPPTTTPPKTVTFNFSSSSVPAAGGCAVGDQTFPTDINAVTSLTYDVTSKNASTLYLIFGSTNDTKSPQNGDGQYLAVIGSPSSVLRGSVSSTDNGLSAPKGPAIYNFVRAFIGGYVKVYSSQSQNGPGPISGIVTLTYI